MAKELELPEGLSDSRKEWRKLVGVPLRGSMTNWRPLTLTNDGAGMVGAAPLLALSFLLLPEAGARIAVIIILFGGFPCDRNFVVVAGVDEEVDIELVSAPTRDWVAS